MEEKKYKCPKNGAHGGLILDKMPEEHAHNWKLSCEACGEFIKWASNREADAIMTVGSPGAEEIKAFVIAVFKRDKTPGYGYSGKERDADRFGNLPGNGKRWQTPAELAWDFAHKHHFKTELFERSEDS